MLCKQVKLSKDLKMEMLKSFTSPFSLVINQSYNYIQKILDPQNQFF